MTKVSELIAHLQTLPQDAYCFFSPKNMYHNVINVSDIKERTIYEVAPGSAIDGLFVDYKRSNDVKECAAVIFTDRGK